MKISAYWISTAVLLVVALIATYSNHFDNGFHFDDTHTIVNNEAIRDLGNIPEFFSDAATTSSLPANQAYRPGLTTLNAIDYWLAGDLDPFQFHLSIFASYLLLGFLLFFFFGKVFQEFREHPHFKWLPLLATAFYMLHTANAETINYIIARSDSFSTFMIMLAFVLYVQWPHLRKFQFFLVPIFIGFFVKEPVVMFAPLLMLYHFLFESKPEKLWSKESRKAAFSAILVGMPALILGGALFVFSQSMTPEHWDPTGFSRWEYLRTQPFVIVHYFNNFILPVNLSADTDWTVFTQVWDDRMLAGLAFLSAMFVLILRLAIVPNWRSVAFGFGWFLLALLPTSSIFPLGEVLNDHRPFFPYIGLAIASGGAFFALWVKWEKQGMLNLPGKSVALGGVGLLLLAHALGTNHRNEVWHDSESLWYDVTIKSPKNGRGLMNYGNVLMAQAKFPEALDYFNRALVYNPNYSYLYINIGVLNGAIGKKELAETNFLKAQQLNPNNPGVYFYYARWLNDVGRVAEAKTQLEANLRLSPQHVDAKALLAQIEQQTGTKVDRLLGLVETNPTPENFLNLSLEYYNLGQYEKCIEAAHSSLALRPGYALAWNNICTGYNALQEWSKAEEACQNGLKSQPDMELLQNNLKVAQQNLK